LNHSIYEETVLGKAYDSRLAKRLLVYLQPYRFLGILSIVLLLILTGLQLAGPYLIKIAIDDYMAVKNFSGIQIIALIFLGILLVQVGVQLTQTILLEWIGQRIMAKLRLDIFSHLQRLQMSFFDRNPVGRLVTRVTTDVDTLNEIFTEGFIAIFGDIFSLLGIIIVMLQLNWKMALLTFCILPFLTGATFFIRTRLRNNFREVRLRIAKINAFLQENITGMSTVQLFNREKKNFEQFDGLNQHHLEAHLKTIFYFALFFPVVQLLLAIAISSILWYGGHQIFQQVLSFGVLVAFIQYVERFFHPLTQLAERYNIMQAAMASAERIFNLLDEKITIQSPVSPDQVENPTGEIEFKKVSFKYPSSENHRTDEPCVLKDISFTVKPGEKVAIVGATGAGKTTLMNVLTRFYDIQSGEILIDGINIKNMDLKELRQNIGIVLQDVFVFARNIAGNIRLGNTKIELAQIIQAAKEVHLDPFIQTLPEKYSEIMTERGSSLSTGQRQLLAFARALAFNPKILVLDEATSSVDPETERLIQLALLRLLENRTAIIIAHRLSTIEHADKIIVLHKGSIRQQGTPQQLLREEGIYRRLYSLQYVKSF
jgi:ATP-binding cassette subfamily B protein